MNRMKTREERESNNSSSARGLWKQKTLFGSVDDWVFASPFKLGRLPYSYTGFWRELEQAAKAAGIGHLGTHAFRHTYRSWLDAVGTPIAVQQKLMRHSDIQTTLRYVQVTPQDVYLQYGRAVAQHLRPLPRISS